jgi:hypothetical protein
VDTAAGVPGQGRRVDPLDGDALLTRQRQRLVDAAIAARPDTQPLHPPAAQRLEDGVQAVYLHQFRLQASGFRLRPLQTSGFELPEAATRGCRRLEAGSW